MRSDLFAGITGRGLDVGAGVVCMQVTAEGDPEKGFSKLSFGIGDGYPFPHYEHY